MSFFRLAGDAIAKFLSRSADPATDTARVQLYNKGGQLYARVPSGSVYQITPASPTPDIVDTEGVSVVIGTASPRVPTILGFDNGYTSQLQVWSDFGVATGLVAVIGDVSSGHVDFRSYQSSIMVVETSFGLIRFQLNDTTDAGTSGNGTKNDCAVDSSFKQIETTGAMTITGFQRLAALAPGAGGPGGNFFCDVSVVGTNDVTLKHEDAGSIAANRIRLPGAADLVIRPNGGFRMVYTTIPGIGQRWQVLAVNA